MKILSRPFDKFCSVLRMISFPSGTIILFTSAYCFHISGFPEIFVHPWSPLHLSKRKEKSVSYVYMGKPSFWGGWKKNQHFSVRPHQGPEFSELSSGGMELSKGSQRRELWWWVRKTLRILEHGCTYLAETCLHSHWPCALHAGPEQMQDPEPVPRTHLPPNASFSLRRQEANTSPAQCLYQGPSVSWTSLSPSLPRMGQGLLTP